jgi:hypothetical protein
MAKLLAVNVQLRISTMDVGKEGNLVIGQVALIVLLFLFLRSRLLLSPPRQVIVYLWGPPVARIVTAAVGTAQQKERILINASDYVMVLYKLD